MDKSFKPFSTNLITSFFLDTGRIKLGFFYKILKFFDQADNLKNMTLLLPIQLKNRKI